MPEAKYQAFRLATTLTQTQGIQDAIDTCEPPFALAMVLHTSLAEQRRCYERV